MQKESFEFLKQLLETPSPSGFERDLQRIIKKRMTHYVHDIQGDVHGNLMTVFNPSGKIKVMLAGHCDQIGMMCTHIDEKGFLYFNQIGGIDPSVLPGREVIIHTREKKIIGVIGHKPVHLLSNEERGKKVDIFKMWIDIGASNAKEASKLVGIGDPITFKLGVSRLGEHFISSPACDDKVGVFVVMETMRILASKVKGSARKRFPLAVYGVSTVQEELGLRGARTSCFGIDPQIGIAVDVTHASDNPGAEAKRIGNVKLGQGPTIARGANINSVLEDLLVSTAKRKKLKYQSLSAPAATGTDANAMQISRAGVATALIGIPNRYMHTPVEIVDLRDLETASKLIAETLLKITSRMNFVLL